MKKFNSSLEKNPIAIVGMSAMFADAANLEQYWNNIVQSKDSITDVPDSRWAIGDYYDEDVHAADKTYCKRGGFLPEIDFDAMEFGLPPNILEVTDVSQLLSLVAARDAFEDAGYGAKSPKMSAELREKTGVILGVGGGQKLITPLMSRLQYPVWERALRSSGVAESDIPVIVDKIKKAYVGWNENSFPGMLGNVISGRITNRFDLGGINSVVDAACAASLSAIRMSLSELVEGRCDMMLTGGVDTDNSPFMYMSFSKTPAFSKSGNIRPFDDNADGMLIGEGIGMMVLRRLDDALRDGDKIYAVIKGVGASSDGRYKSVYAPRPAGQAIAMRRAYEDAGFAASTVGLIEGHGTGTGAGDPTEFTSMQMVFGHENPRKNHIGLGSVKSQIGHCKSSAGVAGMIKAALALYHKVLPATLNVTKPNTKFQIENSAFYINSITRPWFADAHPRRAGISAFGFGGINLHFAMEEFDSQPLAQDRMHTPYQAVLLHATSSAALLEQCASLKAQLLSKDGPTAYYNLLQSSQGKRAPGLAARLGFVTTSLSDTVEKLDLIGKQLDIQQAAWEHPKGIYFRSRACPKSHQVAALFSGQGAQYVGMGCELANAFPAVHQSIADFDALFSGGFSDRAKLSQQMYPNPAFTEQDKQQQQQQLTQTQFAQPAIGSISMGLFTSLKKAGFKADLCGGHSFGELTAIWAAGMLSDGQYRALAMARGQAMANTGSTDAGSMLAVSASEAQVAAILPQLAGVAIANINSPSQLVLAGSSSAITQALAVLKNNGLRAVQLPVSAAFHTPFMRHAQQTFASAVAATTFAAAQCPVYANASASVYPDDLAQVKTILSNQILQPVYFKTQIENMYAAGARIFVEFGPKSILTNLVKDILQGKQFEAIALNANAKKNADEQFRLAVLQLQVLGLDIAAIDTHQRQAAAPKVLSAMNVKLSGNNYVSAPTQAAYQQALSDGFKISGPETVRTVTERITERVEVPVVETVVETVVQTVVETVERIVEKVVEREVPVFHNTPDQSIQDDDMNPNAAAAIRDTLASFQQHQQNSLAAFERFMADQNKQSLAFFGLLSQQMQPANAPALGVAGNLSLLGEASETRQFAQSDAPVAAPVAAAPVAAAVVAPAAPAAPVAAAPVAPAPVVTAPAAVAPVVVPAVAPVSVPVAAAVVAAAPAVTNDKVISILMRVVSEKTGYPVEMLELGMDMEADLGIDSIKRVEIFGAITEQHPELTGIKAQELAELRTLAEIVSYISSKNLSAPVAMPAMPATAATPAATSSPAGPAVVVVPQAVEITLANPPAAANDQIVTILMRVVSQKTGYPAEMLELSMDMESDLGIDSIKRVEIFGAITEQHPEISGINPQALAELRTLDEIVGYMGRQQLKKKSA